MLRALYTREFTLLEIIQQYVWLKNKLPNVSNLDAQWALKGPSLHLSEQIELNTVQNQTKTQKKL